MPERLARQVAQLSLEDLATFVYALPRVALVSLCAIAEDRVQTDRWARGGPPPTVVVAATAALDPDAILTADEAAHELKMSLDTLYARVHRGEVVALPRPPGGRLRFRRGDLRGPAAVANGTHRRYIRPHDSTRRANPPPPARLDAAPARGGPQRDSDDRRALGTRRAGRDAARRDEPWAPGQGAWTDPEGDPRPKGNGS